MIKCENCGADLAYLETDIFHWDGSDDWVQDVTYEEHEGKAVTTELGTDWTGYGLSEEEQTDTIRCPICRNFPFKCKEIQTYTFVKVVMFKSQENDNG